MNCFVSRALGLIGVCLTRRFGLGSVSLNVDVFSWRCCICVHMFSGVSVYVRLYYIICAYISTCRRLFNSRWVGKLDKVGSGFHYLMLRNVCWFSQLNDVWKFGSVCAQWLAHESDINFWIILTCFSFTPHALMGEPPSIFVKLFEQMSFD